MCAAYKNNVWSYLASSSCLSNFQKLEARFWTLVVPTTICATSFWYKSQSSNLKFLIDDAKIQIIMNDDDLEEDEVDTSLLSILGAFLLHLNKRMKRGTTIYFKLWFAGVDQA